MKPFVFKHGTNTWDPTLTMSLLHVYVLIEPERHHELIALAVKANQALHDFPLTPVEPPWPHITIDQITDRPTALIPQSERDYLVLPSPSTLPTSRRSR